jgi:hypothetical protein
MAKRLMGMRGKMEDEGWMIKDESGRAGRREV